jgi:isoamylase
VPMLAAGDEIGKSSGGNNNTYAQDNELSWINWSLDERARSLLEFTREVFAIRFANPVLRRRSFFHGRSVSASGGKDVTWLRPDGQEMTEGDWHDPNAHVLGMFLDGRATDDKDDRGRPIVGQTLLLLVNGGPKSRAFTLPSLESPGNWRELVNTARPGLRIVKAAAVNLAAHSLILLRYEGAR